MKSTVGYTFILIVTHVGNNDKTYHGLRGGQAHTGSHQVGGSENKESFCNAGDPDLISQSGRSPGEGNGNPFQYSCLENSMDREAWQATVLGGHKESDMTERLNLIDIFNGY